MKFEILKTLREALRKYRSLLKILQNYKFMTFIETEDDVEHRSKFPKTIAGFINCASLIKCIFRGVHI